MADVRRILVITCSTWLCFDACHHSVHQASLYNYNLPVGKSAPFWWAVLLSSTIGRYWSASQLYIGQPVSYILISQSARVFQLVFASSLVTAS